MRRQGVEPDVAYVAAGAAAEVALRRDPRVAAVASRRAAEHRSLAILAEDLAPPDRNFTRFFALTRRDDPTTRAAVPAALRSGSPKTSLVFAVHDQAGALVRALQPFATAGVNLAKIESRPSRAQPWDYCFYVDLHGDPDVSPTREAVALLRLTAAWVEILGTYPMEIGRAHV